METWGKGEQRWNFLESTGKTDKGWRARQLSSEMWDAAWFCPRSEFPLPERSSTGSDKDEWVSLSPSFFPSFALFSLSLSFLGAPNQNKMLQSLVYHSDSGQENIIKSQKVLQDGKTISQTGLAMSSRTFKQLWSKTAPQPNPFWLSPVKWVFSKYYIMTSLNPTKLFPQEITLSQLDSNYLLYLMTP